MEKRYNRINIEELEKKEVHKVPENYFDVLPGLIQNRISKRNDLTPALIKVYFRPVLASLFILFILGALWFIWRDKTEPENKVSTTFPVVHPKKLNHTNQLSDSSLIAKEGTHPMVSESAPPVEKQKLQNTSATAIQNPEALLAGINSRDIAQYLRNLEENEQEDLTEDF